MYFRTKYSNYEQYVLHKLTSELTNTYSSIRDSKWLLGVNYVYDFVMIGQKLHGKTDRIDFMTWINMQTDMMSLAQSKKHKIKVALEGKISSEI